METVKILGQACPKISNEILYIVPEKKGCVISHLNIVNADIYDSLISIRIGSAENLENNPDVTQIESNMLVYANCSSQRLKGVTLAAGDIVEVASASDFISFSLFGSEFDQDFSYQGEPDNGYGIYDYPIFSE
jgi:hypothetical protein